MMKYASAFFVALFLLTCGGHFIAPWNAMAQVPPGAQPIQTFPMFLAACPNQSNLQIAGTQFTIDCNGNFTGAGGVSVLTPSAIHTLYMEVGGTGTGLACANIATPCPDFPTSAAAASSLVQGSKVITVEVLDNGPYVGGPLVIAPPKGGMPTSANRGYPEVIYNGTVGQVVVTENPSFTESVLFANNYTSLELINFTLQKATGSHSGFDFLSAGFSQVILENMVYDNNTNSVSTEGMVDSEVYGLVELVGTQTVLGGTSFAFEGEDQGNIQNQASTITCGTGFAFTDSFWFLNHSMLDDETGSTYSGCPSTGVGVHANGGSQWKVNGSTTAPPGNTLRIASNDTVFPTQFQASVTGCTNGAIRSGSTNYSGWVNFTGANSTCTVTFGEPAGYTSYFNERPSCGVSGTAAATISATAANSFTFAGTFANAQSVYYNCQPFDGG